ncbi:enoyl-CoA hydratase-related protein [Nocardioides euryhalodurans]|uniref:Enoyl-CoA hydratase n=1 Tax=Nocardioides euryhalodurans TaxID=2518370 RepID=A0A4P7GNP1_9ACTN|nr:enoyl-CoA hydratase-related protein [Nocardioides euryhalodurans]QBR93825.1 enoyl-CoA hydratase [Nocardioides euryhalodurans]
MTTPGLAVTEDDGVLTIRLDRPAAYNALTDAMTTTTSELLERAGARDEVRVVVLTGTGPAFCTGADIAGDDAAERFDVRALDAANRLVRAILRCDKPVVAGVNGIAAGVGLSAVLACDLAMCAESASFLLAFSRVGLMPDGGATATVAASVGRARAMRMALLAEPLRAREAYDVGLVSHLASDADYDRELAALVDRLRHGAPLAQAATKRAVNAAALAQLEPALELERTSQTLLLRTADAAEGMRAFTEKRRPIFTGD